MSVGFGVAGAQVALNALRAAFTFTKLHVGDPGAAGTANPAVNTTRVAATFGTTDSAGAFTTTADQTWTNVAGTEDYTYFSQWSLVTAGTFGWSGTVVSNPVTAGDTFTILTGNLDTSVVLAA